jgi:hypothetical protein
LISRSYADINPEQQTMTIFRLILLPLVIIAFSSAAQTTTGRTVSEEPHAKAIRSLRREIRALNVPEARHPDLNWHPEETEPTHQLPKTP